VDLYRHNCLFDYADNTALLAYQDAESIAQAAIRLLTDNPYFEKRQEACLTFSEPRSMKWEMDGLLNAVLGQISGKPFDRDIPTRLYSEQPVIAEGPSQKAAAIFCYAQANGSV
jgi:hypothetical protein